jgi:hypothetical protein
MIELQLIQMSTKELLSSKNIMHTSAASYLVLHTCVSLSSNCQKFVSYSPCHIFCSLMPLDATNFVNVTTQNTAGLLHIWWTQSRLDLCSVHWTNDCKLTHTAEFPLHRVQDITAGTGCFQNQDSGSSFLFGAAVERICASFQGGPQKSALRCGFVYNCIVNARRKAVFVPVFTLSLSFVVAYNMCH